MSAPVATSAPVTEVITWHKVADELPDADTTVHIFNAKWSEPVWQGYLDGDVWRDLEGTSLDAEGLGKKYAELAPPTHWAHMPAGPE